MCCRWVPSVPGKYHGQLAKTVLVLLLVVSSAPADTPDNDLLRGFEKRVQAAFTAVEGALASEEARLHDLAVRHSRRTLADGRPSVSQAAANASLWEQRIGKLRGEEAELRRELNELLTALSSKIAAATQRLAGGSEQNMPMEPGPGPRERAEVVRQAEPSSSSVDSDASAVAPPDDHAAMELSLGLDRAVRALVQMGLTSIGFDSGPADGLFGKRTRSAIRSWQSANEHQATGHLTRLQANLLIAAGRDAEQKRVAERERREQGRIARQREEQQKAELAKDERQRQQRQAEIKQTPVDQGVLGSIAGEVFRDCPDCPEMVVVPSGSFRMGGPPGETGRQDNEGPQHWVEIGQPFAMGVYEVTRGQYFNFLVATNRTWSDTCVTFEGGEIEEREDRSWQNPGFHQTDQHPVVCVSWDDAREYVNWLSLQTGEMYRLLSESEWEYAARAGTSTARYWGNSESDQCLHANGLDSSTDLVGRSGRVGCRDGYPATSPAGTFTTNPFGAHDVLGNVWEWTQDCWADSYGSDSDDGRSRQIAGCENRVIRGGSWINGPTFLRSARRDRIPPGRRFNVVGFRIGRAVEIVP